MEIDIKDKEIINQTVDFVRTYHSKQSKLPVVPGPDEEGLKLLSRVYTIAKKYRQQEKENHYKDEYGAITWHCDSEFYRNIHFVLTWCDKFSVFIDGDARAPAEPKAGKRKSRAAARLQSQELQEVKAKLIKAGIIVDGAWQGTPAEFGCLVNELRDERGINDHGRRAWKEVARWVGYDGNIESARSAIEKHIDTEGDVADKIRAICLANK